MVWVVAGEPLCTRHCSSAQLVKQARAFLLTYLLYVNLKPVKLYFTNLRPLTEKKQQVFMLISQCYCWCFSLFFPSVFPGRKEARGGWECWAAPSWPWCAGGRAQKWHKTLLFLVARQYIKEGWAVTASYVHPEQQKEFPRSLLNLGSSKLLL